MPSLFRYYKRNNQPFAEEIIVDDTGLVQSISNPYNQDTDVLFANETEYNQFVENILIEIGNAKADDENARDLVIQNRRNIAQSTSIKLTALGFTPDEIKLLVTHQNSNKPKKGNK